MRVGVIRELRTGLSEEVAGSFDAALAKLGELGAELTEVSLPAIDHVSAIATTITFAEAAEYHQQWIRTRADDYGRDVRRALEAGMLMPAVLYIRAQRARAVLLAQALSAPRTLRRAGRADGRDSRPADSVSAPTRSCRTATRSTW